VIFGAEVYTTSHKIVYTCIFVVDLKLHAKHKQLTDNPLSVGCMSYM
jgi:hypothetical protein